MRTPVRRRMRHERLSRTRPIGIRESTFIMGTIPTKEKWLASTALRGRIRSSALDKVDDAISACWKRGGDVSPNKKANLTAIRVADGWKAEIESLIKTHIHPVLDQCASLIQSSPFIITDIPLHRAANRSSLSALAHAAI